MKERVDSTKMLPNVNGPGSDPAAPGTGVVPKLEPADIKMEVKEEESGRKSTDSRPPSRKLPNGDTDAISVKSEDNNNKRIKLEKKQDNGKLATENGKPGSVGRPDSRNKSSPHTPQPASIGPGSGTSTPSGLPSTGTGNSSGGGTPQHQPQQQQPPPVMASPQPMTGMVTSHEPPYMQQQSEIFVFSTAMANQAAESVKQGHCKTIIQFHMDQPITKAFFEKNAMKLGNPRQNMPGMMGGPMKGQGMGGPGGMVRMPGPNWGPQQGNQPGSMEDPMMGPGGPSNNMMPNGGQHYMGGPSPRMMGPGGMQGGPMGGPVGPGGFPGGPQMMPGDMERSPSNGMMGPGPVPFPHTPINNPLSVSQVPDENLTMEQRQHRSKGLAQLTKIHQMLMGGNNNNGNPNGGANGTMVGPNGPSGPMDPGQGMYGPVNGPGMMTSQQQAMMQQQQQQAMMSQGGNGMMGGPHPGMMSPQHQQMMQPGMGPYGPRGPPGMGPPGMNGKDQFQAQHDWYQIQRDFYLEKQHRMQMARGGPGGPMGGPMHPHMEPGPPPPSYYSSISQKHGGMGPPSPGGMNGMRMPMGPHGGPPNMGMEGPDGMYGGGPPPHPHMGMDPGMPGMYPPHGMPPQGPPMEPGFDPSMMGPGGPHMMRHPHPHGHPMRPGHPGHMMGPNGMMGPGMKPPGLPAGVTLHRAGNPEQFNPETMGGVVPPPTSVATTNGKPPPSYAQAQKRKRGAGDDVGDEGSGYGKGNLQQTPSPTKIQYHLSQFEGQELTITKQLNTAFVGDDQSSNPSGPITSSAPAMGGGGAGPPHSFSCHNSPIHGPGSNKGPLSNSSQASAHNMTANSPSVAGPSPHHQPGGPSTPMSSSGIPAPANTGANMRLSHFDPSSSHSNGLCSTPHTPTPKLSSSSSTMSNITSASLANLAKGVEDLSNQMQQNMMQGGPFHSIQVQGQMTSTGGSGNITNGSNNGSNNAIIGNGGNLGHDTPTATTATTTSAPSSSLPSHATSSLPTSLSSPANPSKPSSIQPTSMPASCPSPNMGMHNNSNPGGPPFMGPGSHPSPQYPMNSYLNMPPGGQQGIDVPGMMPNGPRPSTPQSHHLQMAQQQGMLAAAAMGPMGQGGAQGMAPSPGIGPHMGPQQHMSGSGMMGPNSHPHPHQRHNSASSLPPTPPIMSKPGQFTSPPLSQHQMVGVGSPSFPAAMTPTSASTPNSSNTNSSGPGGVQIQQKGQNTIQYLPANPPSSNTSTGAPIHPQQPHPSMGGMPPGPGKPMPSEMPPDMSYGMPRFPSPMHAVNEPKPPHPHTSSTLQYFPSSSPSSASRTPSISGSVAAMGPEFASQAQIAMQQSASMMTRSPSMPDIPGIGMVGPGPNPMDSGANPNVMGGPPGGPSPMSMMGMGCSPDMSGPGGPMRPGQSPMRHPSMMPSGMGGAPLECVSPTMGQSIEQAQAQAQAHAAAMMVGATPPSSGPSPHINTSAPPQQQQPPPGPSPHMHGGHMPQTSPMPSMPGHSPHPMPGPMLGGPMPGHSTMGGPMGGPMNGPMSGPLPGHSPHGGPMPGPMAGPMPGGMPGQATHGHQMVPPCTMGGPAPHCGPPHPMHGPGGMPSRHPGGMMGPGGMYGPAPGSYGPPHGYQPDYYGHGPGASPRGPVPRQMMGPGMMGGPPGGQPYGMMSNMPGPS